MGLWQKTKGLTTEQYVKFQESQIEYREGCSYTQGKAHINGTFPGGSSTRMKVIHPIIKEKSQVHACNPSYLGGRDEKDHTSGPTMAKKETLFKNNTKKGLVEWLKP
jgi:hypothetical protein